MDKYLRNRRIKTSFKEDIELHEILLDKLAKQKEEELGVSEKKYEVPLLKKILNALLIFCFIIFALLFIKDFQLQVLEHQNLQALSESNKYISRSIEAKRGVIYDGNLKQLVFNKPRFDLVFNKQKFLDSKISFENNEEIKEIAKILNQETKELERQIIESETSPVLVVKNLDHQTLVILQARINNFPHFQIINSSFREYLDGKIFSHVIGYTNQINSQEIAKEPQFYSLGDYVGRAGVENYYEKILRKNPGQMRIEKDALGNIISSEITQLPESGKSLVLWLDSDLQKKIVEVLEKQYQNLGAKGAAAVALDPKTGGVLALVSLPSFDNNIFQTGANLEISNILNDPNRPLFNRAISGRGYSVGSTIKPFIAAAALEEKIITPEKQIYAGGSIEVVDKNIPGKVWVFSDWKVHGWTDLRKAIADSVNIYFYTIGGGYEDIEGLGVDRIKKYLELFGWGQKTGIDLPSEGEGLIPCPEWKASYFKNKEDQQWYLGDTYNLSIGQGFVLATPLQVAVSTAAIANGGKLFQPQLLKEIVDVNRKTIKEFSPRIIRENFVNPTNLRVVKEGMGQTVSSGTAFSYLNLLPGGAGAKTGSAQTGKKDKNGRDILHNWITVFAPYEEPEIVLTIILEDVPGEVMGGSILPAKEILDWYLNQKK